MGKLRPKQKKFVEAYLEHGNGTQAVIDAGYDVKSRDVARKIGSENLTKPDVMAFLQSKTPEAANSIYKLAIGAENEAVMLNASRDILDRTGFKPVDPDASRPNVFVINLSEEQKDNLRRLLL